jgi:hypothetical protein
MSFSISKNKMSFTADNKSVSKELTTTTDKIVAKSSTFLLDTVNYSAEDSIYHATFQFRAFLPNLQIANTKGGSMYLWSGGTSYWANYPSGQGEISGIQDIPNSARLPTVEPANHLRDYPIT